MFQQEISLIILQSLFIYLFFKYPIFNLKNQNIVTKDKFLSSTDSIIVNILVFLNIFGAKMLVWPQVSAMCSGIHIL